VGSETIFLHLAAGCQRMSHLPTASSRRPDLLARIFVIVWTPYRSWRYYGGVYAGGRMARHEASPCDASGELRRRSPRIAVQVPIGVSFGDTIASGHTAIVNRHGALILCIGNYVEGDVLDVMNKTTQESVRCRVVWCSSEIADGVRKLGVEMEEDRAAFWGIDFSALSDSASTVVP
jgi:hypothetical protein